MSIPLSSAPRPYPGQPYGPWDAVCSHPPLPWGQICPLYTCLFPPAQGSWESPYKACTTQFCKGPTSWSFPTRAQDQIWLGTRIPHVCATASLLLLSHQPSHPQVPQCGGPQDWNCILHHLHVTCGLRLMIHTRTLWMRNTIPMRQINFWDRNCCFLGDLRHLG